MKKIILSVFAATSLLLYSTPSFALLSVSVGVPIGASLKADDGSEVADGASGYFLGVQLPFGLGLGMDSHKTTIKDTDGKLKVATSMYNLFYQLPVPVVSLILGLGVGSSNFDCPDQGGGTCAEQHDKGAATQWYTSIGMPILPLFDIHLSYRSITSKNITQKSNKEKSDVSGTVTGIGLAFNF